MDAEEIAEEIILSLKQDIADTLDELENRPIKRLKDIRKKQLDLLEPGFTDGSYHVTVTSFDGRVIKRTTAKDHQAWISLYMQESKAWNQAATVKATIEFEMF